MVLNHIYWQQPAGPAGAPISIRTTSTSRMPPAQALCAIATMAKPSAVHDGLGTMSKSKQQRRGSAGTGGEVRRGHGAALHDVHGAARAVARVVGRGRAGLVPLHQAGVEGRVRPRRRGSAAASSIAAALDAAQRTCAAGAPDARQGHRRHRPPAHLQHRDRRGDGVAEQRSACFEDGRRRGARRGPGGVRDSSLLMLSPIVPHICHATVAGARPQPAR
jgi:hypothetical protein